MSWSGHQCSLPCRLGVVRAPYSGFVVELSDTLCSLLTVVDGRTTDETNGSRFVRVPNLEQFEELEQPHSGNVSVTPGSREGP